MHPPPHWLHPESSYFSVNGIFIVPLRYFTTLPSFLWSSVSILCNLLVSKAGLFFCGKKSNLAILWWNKSFFYLFNSTLSSLLSNRWLAFGRFFHFPYILVTHPTYSQCSTLLWYSNDLVHYILQQPHRTFLSYICSFSMGNLYCICLPVV